MEVLYQELVHPERGNQFSLGHKWLYKGNQYFDREEIRDSERLKLASYYLDGIANYWHQNFMRSLRNQEITWGDYVEAMCARFGGYKILQRN